MGRMHAVAALAAALGAAAALAALSTAGPWAPAPDDRAPAALGAATVVHLGADGSIVGEQRAHNRLLDAGESFILNQTFRGPGAGAADGEQIGAICLSAGAAQPSEAMTRADFDAAHDAADSPASAALNCRTDDSVAVSGSVATVGPLEFRAGITGSDNWHAGDTVRTIGVCRADAAGADVRGCAGPLFAYVDLPVDSALATGESFTVTYTFSMATDTT